MFLSPQDSVRTLYNGCMFRGVCVGLNFDPCATCLGFILGFLLCIFYFPGMLGLCFKLLVSQLATLSAAALCRE